MFMMIGSGSRLGHIMSHICLVPPGFTIVEPWIHSRSLLAEVGSRTARGENIVGERDPVLSRGNP